MRTFGGRPQFSNTVNSNPHVGKCEKCNKWVHKNVADYSMKKYGKILCYDCQQLEKLKTAYED